LVSTWLPSRLVHASSERTLDERSAALDPGGEGRQANPRVGRGQEQVESRCRMCFCVPLSWYGGCSVGCMAEADGRPRSVCAVDAVSEHASPQPRMIPCAGNGTSASMCTASGSTASQSGGGGLGTVSLGSARSARGGSLVCNTRSPNTFSQLGECAGRKVRAHAALSDTAAARRCRKLSGPTSHHSRTACAWLASTLAMGRLEHAVHNDSLRAFEIAAQAPRLGNRSTLPWEGPRLSANRNAPAPLRRPPTTCVL